ncbi:hypothetical protein HQ563_00900 [bacterium]|nr:hypothetical protein [bacterium]
MAIRRRLQYYRRIIATYILRRPSQITEWHEEPEVNDSFSPSKIGEYYTPCIAKADYSGKYDAKGIPLLNYGGHVGLQHSPAAIAEYGLGNYNLFCRMGDPGRRRRFLLVADWLVANLEENSAGLWVWNYHFDWDYRTLLKAPWYSALAQGLGLSLLVRAHRETDRSAYLEAAERSFETFLKTTDEGGVSYIDGKGYTWLEEAVIDPPTHVLNGFVWAMWGVYDYYLYTRSREAERLFAETVRTLKDNLHRFDVGFWSLYELSGSRMKMLASPFYQRLHIVQLSVMHRLTGEPVFAKFARRWELYRRSRTKRAVALGCRALFKLVHY